MLDIEIYSPFDDFGMYCPEYRSLVYAINRTLKLTDNEAEEYGKIRKSISVEQILDANKMINNVWYPTKPWDVEYVKSALNRNLSILKRLYELHGWNISCFQHPIDIDSQDSDSRYDGLIFEFNIE